MSTFNNQSRVANQANQQHFHGPVHIGISHENVTNTDLGLHLFNAPAIDESFFTGRDGELNQIKEKLLPDQASDPETPRRRLVVLGGIGGIGKTQLAIAFTKKFRNSYRSIFWLDATSETTLKASFDSMANLLFNHEQNDDRMLIQVLRWLSDKANSQWLLVFDNHDEPNTYQIEKYFPSASHGSILITTRLPDMINGWQIKLTSLSQDSEGLHILQTRSMRKDVKSDPNAKRLAHRLNGFPLALATAGAYLKLTPSVSFGEYLQQYEARWKVSQRRSRNLPEYSQRTLYTTWDISFNRLKEEDHDAATTLKFLAYFSHQRLWYKLFHAGYRGQDQPEWFITLSQYKTNFDDIMSTLTSYCFIEGNPETFSYSIHICVHDWIIDGLNSTIDKSMYWLAFNCVSASIDPQDWGNYGLAYASISAHAAWLVHDRFDWIISSAEFCNQYQSVEYIAEVLYERGSYTTANKMYELALLGREKALGADHTSTLSTVNNLGLLYVDQGKLAQAEEMYQRALAGREKALGVDHTSTLSTVNNLGILYRQQGKLAQAEEMYQRALAGREKALGADHTSTLDAVNNLGVLYANQGKLAQAEEMYQRALAGREKALGANHTSTLQTVNNLGVLYADQGKPQAEEMYQRALAGKEKALGADHTSTLDTVNNLGVLYADQGKLAQAEEMYQRALAGYEKALGPEHPRTRTIAKNLHRLHSIHNSELLHGS